MEAMLDLSLRKQTKRITEMPIPGDNGNPEKEKRDQENRIIDVANEGACVQKEVKLNPPCPKEKSIFGDV